MSSTQDDCNEELKNDPIILHHRLPRANQLHRYKICALVVHCRRHHSIALQNLPHLNGRYYWLPFVAIAQESTKWLEMGSIIGEIFCKEMKIPYNVSKSFFAIENSNKNNEQSIVFEKFSIRSLTRIQLPNAEFIEQIIFSANWIHKICCSDTNHIKWIPIETFKPDSNLFLNIRKRIWGPEILKFSSNDQFEPVSQNHYHSIEFKEQTGKLDVLKYFNSELDRNNSSSKTKIIFNQFLSEAMLEENQIVTIYNHYVQHCYPSTSMSLASFVNFSHKIKLDQSIDLNLYKLPNIFKAMNYKIKNFIGFNEFLLGLICLDPKAPHTQPRFTFLFRYYDSDSDGFISEQELEKLHSDLEHYRKRSLQSSPSSSPSTAAAAQEDYKTKIDYETFVTAINTQKIKGTEFLCRSNKSIIKLFEQSEAFDSITFDQKPFRPKILSNCVKCRRKNYCIALHSLRLDRKGRLKDSRLILDHRPRKHPLQRHSLEYIFNENSNANYILNLIRKLYGVERMDERRKKEITTEVINGLSFNVIKNVCDDVSEIFATESRILKISTPIYILGDIHGNINDLLIFEAQLWPMAPAVTSSNVLFLGDYVDRGEFSIEVVCYLFAMKILCPIKFHLLRGNHEIRSIQRSFTFEKECSEKYGRFGPNIFETFNQVFDLIPFAAIVDESIYCAHGGIPFSLTKIEDLVRLPVVLQDPEQEAPAVWEILWSDPMTNIEFQELSNFMKKTEHNGYLSNMKRSTAFYFAEKATQNFLKQNNLSHVIRAHEVIEEGFKFNHRGMVLTVFSCSKYCGGPNKAAAIMIEEYDRKGFIKIISLET
ncbi:tRNA dimethylallyltransferase [Sarcoptes scabiei]|nr:tRNA dimethylallyltransferase [Sarcoptes scabiei]